MGWILIAIITHFFWALANVGDRYVLLNRIKNPYIYLFWLYLLGGALAMALPFLHPLFPSGTNFLWLVLAGVVYFYGGLPYVKAMQVEEVTRINIWWSFLSIFSLFIGWFVLGDKLNSGQLLAMVILLAAAVLASLRGRGKTVVFSKNIYLMIVACLAYAIYASILRYVTRDLPFVTAFIWVNIIMAFLTPTLFLSKKFRTDFSLEIKNFFPQIFGLVLIFSLLEKAGIFFNIWNLSLASASLIYSFEAVQLLFVFVISILITIKNPRLLAEDLSRRNLLYKFLALALMIAGIIILNNV